MSIVTTNSVSLFTEFDVYLFRQGKYYRMFETFGAHLITHNGKPGVYFAVWAPNAKYVSVLGNFNYWNKQAAPLFVRNDSTGIWEGFIEGLQEHEVYKYYIINRFTNEEFEKADPVAFATECPPATASVVRKIDYSWNDFDWMEKRKENKYEKPVSIYEVHLGSWKRNAKELNRSLTYLEHAKELCNYVKEMGFTHVELMPVTEHPYYGSWGYQSLGYFAPTSRYGSPTELMEMIDIFHQNDIGIILDWVPSHFPTDAHGLGYFDGTHLYEYADPRKGFHPDWTSNIFNYSRFEVRSFLISSAIFWCEKYHIDGIRVDGVASMLYLDYSRKEGEWIPNEFGGNENIEAIDFLKTLNMELYRSHSDIITIAEESTSWSGVSRPVYSGGLGFGFKWMMGWMNDTLRYFKRDCIYRKYHHGELTFSMIYFFHENFVLPLSHDEVTHGKGSLISRMPGDYWQQFANLRTLLSYMFLHPGAKMLFMGGEIGQFNEWNHEGSIEWNLVEFDFHKAIQTLVKDLNALYKKELALYEKNFHSDGFEWISVNDADRSILSFIRKGTNPDNDMYVLINLTPETHLYYRFGINQSGTYEEIFNSDSSVYHGSDIRNISPIASDEINWDNRSNSLQVKIPPLGAIALKLKK